MTHRIALAAALLLGGYGFAIAQSAPGTPATGNPNLSVASVKMDNGVRLSKMIGSGVYADANTQIGTIEDLLMTPDSKVAMAVVSVGGVLGVGGKLVAIPFSQLQHDGGKTLLPGMTKDQLSGMPNFTYNG